MNARVLIFFGHRGAGTTSVAAHLAAAYAEAGRRTILVGCAGGATTALVSRGRSANSHGWTVGFKGIACREWRPNRPAAGWTERVAGLREEIASHEPAAKLVLIDVADEIAALDALLAGGNVDQVLAVTDAEPASLRAVNSLWRALDGRAVEVGLIGNNLSAAHAEAIVQDFARQTETLLQGLLPRALAVTRSAFFGETVIEAAPLAHPAYLYRELARLLGKPGPSPVPVPLDDGDFRDWAADWGDRLYDLGEGYVGWGGGI